MKLILFQRKKTTKPINQIKMQRYINVNCTMTYFIVYIYTAVEGNLSISWLAYAPHSLVIDFRYLYVSIASLDIHSFGKKYQDLSTLTIVSCRLPKNSVTFTFKREYPKRTSGRIKKLFALLLAVNECIASRKTTCSL